MDKQTAIEEAARKALAVGGPAALTNVHDTVAAVGRALDEGATYAEIAAEMKHQWGQA
ncbi:hypothetical protein [Streptomyces huasconensis]|uniref:hypothetical protein n=1 Tax=Streptomyces huasconensis TaxID=1854574 RepID=UPI0036FAC332